MKKTEFTLQTFVDFLKMNISNAKLRDLIVIIDYFNAAQGGCSCNRERRIKAINDMFDSKILNLNESMIEEIKHLTNSTKLIFYNSLGLILKEF